MPAPGGGGGGAPTFAQPETPGPGHTLQLQHQRDSTTSPSSLVAFRNQFRLDAFGAVLQERLGFSGADAATACDILLEAAPLLLAKNVVALDDAFVSPPPHSPPTVFFIQVTSGNVLSLCHSQ